MSDDITQEQWEAIAAHGFPMSEESTLDEIATLKADLERARGELSQIRATRCLKPYLHEGDHGPAAITEEKDS